MRIELFIVGLDTGGSETQMAVLASGLAGRGHDVRVTTLYPGGAVWNRLAAADEVELESLWAARAGFRPFVALQLLAAPRRLRGRWRAGPADLYHSMLDLSNVIAERALDRARAERLVWGLRGSDNRLTRLLALARRLSIRRSDRVGLVLANSRAGLEFYLANGYRPRRSGVIANGIDTQRFRPAAPEAATLRERWLGDGDVLIGIAARIAPVKDHANFMQAARIVTERRPGCRFVCIGGGRPEAMRRLHALRDEAGLSEACALPGEVADMRAAYGALDLLVLSSFGEGFPNVLAEGMACGLPCVTTDVGDARDIVTQQDRVVPPRDPEALARAILARLEAGRDPDAQRRRIVERFSIDAMLDRFEQAARDLGADRREMP